MDVVSTALHGINIVLILGLLYIYLQNYRGVKSKYTVGLIIFALLFLVQTSMSIYYDASMIMYSTVYAENVAKILEAVKAVSFAILLWISWE